MNLDLKTILPIVAALFVGAGGASSFFITRTESECRASLAGAEARVDLQGQALDACSKALDAVAGAGSGSGTPASPAAAPGVPLDLLGGCSDARAQDADPEVADEPGVVPGCPPPPPCPCAQEATQAAVEAARKAIEATKKK